MAAKTFLAANSAKQTTLISIPVPMADSGTQCSRLAFMRAASTVHVAPSMSISVQVALRTSADLTVVRIRNSRPR